MAGLLDGWTDLVGCKIEIAYNDGERVSLKIGYLNKVTNDLLFLKTQHGTECVPPSSVVRVKVLTQPIGKGVSL